MRYLALMIPLLAACEGVPNVIDVQETCRVNDLTIEVERGGRPCDEVARAVDGYRMALEERWGRVDLEGWTVRLRLTTIVHKAPGTPESVSGQTYAGAKTIDVTDPLFVPHEIGHALHGTGHINWSCTFGAWEIRELGYNQQDYLGACNPLLGDPWR